MGSWTKGVRGLAGSSGWRVWGRVAGDNGPAATGWCLLTPLFVAIILYRDWSAFEINDKHHQREGWW